jgi:hypothetical protein
MRALGRGRSTLPGDGLRAANSIPSAYADFYDMATGAYGGAMYLLDAYPGPYFVTTQKYNTQTDVWASVNQIPIKRATSVYEAAAVTVGSGIHVLGGASTPNRHTHEVYFPLSDTWATKNAIPSGYGWSGQAGGSCGSNIVLTGGYPMKQTTAIYSTTTDTWAAGARLLR